MSRVGHIFNRRHGAKRKRRIARRYLEGTYDLTVVDPKQGDPWWRKKHGREIPSDQATKDLRRARRRIRLAAPPLSETKDEHAAQE